MALVKICKLEHYFIPFGSLVIHLLLDFASNCLSQEHNVVYAQQAISSQQYIKTNCFEFFCLSLLFILILLQSQLIFIVLT